MLTRKKLTIVLICVGALIGGAAAQAHDRGFWGGEAQSGGSVGGGVAAASSPLPILPRGNYSLEDARRFSRFSLYYAGASALGHSLTAVHRIDAKPYPGERVRRDGCHVPLRRVSANLGHVRAARTSSSMELLRAI